MTLVGMTALNFVARGEVLILLPGIFSNVVSSLAAKL
jgi:hypothetical protein